MEISSADENKENMELTSVCDVTKGAISEDWPFEYGPKLIIGNKKSNVGIATLWTVKEKVAEQLNSNDFCVLANFYDVFNGFEPLLRNCLSNPLIRYIIMVGADRSGSKQVLLNFFNLGIDGERIAQTKVPLPKGIPKEDILLFKESVELIDLTDEITDLNDFEQYGRKITEKIRTLEIKGPYAEPKTYKKVQEEISIFPSSGSIFTMHGDFVSDVWIQILNTINTYGINSFMTSDPTSEIRECINVIATVHKEDPDDPKIPKFMTFGKEKLLEYYETFCYGKLPEGTAYTYGHKLRSERGDQIGEIIKKLKESKISKRCYATTWTPGDVNQENPPCLTSIQIIVQDDVSFLTAYFRSNDMFRAWPLNMFGVRKIQKIITEEIKGEMGPTTIISCSAQIYKDNFQETKDIVKKHTVPICYDDPRGYYVIDVEEKEIIVKHFSPTSKLLKTYKNKTGSEIMYQINTSAHPVDRFHLGYLSKELTKAEISINFNLKYTQDKELEKI